MSFVRIMVLSAATATSLAVPASATPASIVPLAAVPLQRLGEQQLRDEKLREEIRNLREERRITARSLMPYVASLVTALVAVVGGLAAAFKVLKRDAWEAAVAPRERNDVQLQRRFRERDRVALRPILRLARSARRVAMRSCRSAEAPPARRRLRDQRGALAERAAAALDAVLGRGAVVEEEPALLAVRRVAQRLAARATGP
jgi:hypothetical protein